MAALLLCVYFLLGVMCGEATGQEQVCETCPGSLRHSSQVSRLCRETPGAKSHARCCLRLINDRHVIIGLDLWNCSLSHLDPSLTLSPAALVLDLSSNPLQDLPSEFFRGLLGLQYIALPATLGCPGGNDSWENVTVTSTVRECRDQRSTCNGTAEWVLCPENAVCSPDGPGYTQCLCETGFHGYKCLREGSFPILMFFGILGLVTACLSVLLWCTQRRKVKSQ
ncbi:all-trans retinoic acid induced differentiation factor S homeolog precursor [Xenopus laevis]|uniref:All-trans retinoic acid induced differentiation factor S homeolog precursor n=2 Tax=Xenopus laevis TaxID=8355 RepID=Q52L06_XENLA|nr:all-trans retinoic acid induced differentiation factor S homeolog precursor [Xenopus laevis]AAH94117.1 MGC115119 protein [Xenopus laevis]OCT79225.1 hypothetical protein XELAEV_18030322mg [Xenopus laevis]